jgi:hypothetical protein
VRERAGLVLLLALLAGVLARGPLLHATLPQPLSNDDALVLLMAKDVASLRPVGGFWNQPYGGALDAWVLAPLARVAPPRALFRAYQLLTSLLLVLLVAALARQAAGRETGHAALLLAAAGPPYLALMGALGMAPYHLAPLIVGLVVLALQAARGPAALAAVGVLAGLNTWNTLLAGPATLGAVAGFALGRGRALRSDARALGAVLAGLLVGMLPLVWQGSPAAATSVAGVRPASLWPAALPDLGRALAGLLGLAPPLVIDGPNRAELPLVAQALLALALLALVALGVRERRAWPLVGWALASVAAFVLGARGRGDRVRYLVLAGPPLVALCAIGAGRLAARRRPAAAVLLGGIVVAWAAGAGLVAAAWRDPSRAPRFWGAVDVAPALGALEGLGLDSGYATTQLAARLTVESGGRAIVSPAWNERFPGFPLRHQGAVDLDPAAAWILHDEISRGMPRAPAFRALLGGLGGAWQETRAGALTVFHGFRPPYDERRPLAPPAVERSAGTLRLAWPEPQAVAGVVLLSTSALEREGWVLATDGVRSDVPAARIQWLNGVPRVGPPGLAVVTLEDVTAREIVVQAREPWPADLRAWAYGPEAPLQAEPGAEAAARGLAHARLDRWAEARAAYAEAARQEPWRASYAAAAAQPD